MTVFISDYPKGWPACPGCGSPVMDGHATCGESACEEGDTRRKRSTSNEMISIEIGEMKLEMSPGGDRAMVYEIDNGYRRWLMTVPTYLDLSEQKLLIVAFLNGRERGQVEGRNELRQRLGSLLNTMESV